MSRLFKHVGSIINNKTSKLQTRTCSNGVVNPNGIAHIQLSVSSKNWNNSVIFYKEWLNKFYGMTVIFDNDTTLYCVGGRTGVLISKCDPEFENDTFNQRKIGLHHICFRLRSNEDVEKTYNFITAFNDKNDSKLKIIRGPELGVWAPGYYSILFEDYDGIRWECNYVPSKGWLDPKYKNKLPHNAMYSKI